MKRSGIGRRLRKEPTAPVTRSNEATTTVSAGINAVQPLEKTVKNRLVLSGIAALAVAGLAVVGCSSDSKDSSSTTTTAKSSGSSSTVGNVLPPIIITPDMVDANNGGTVKVPPIKVGDTVVFNMGPIQQGLTISIARNTNPSVFEVTSKGTNNGTVATNAGGKALAAGTTQVDLGATGNGVENFLGTYTLVITK